MIISVLISIPGIGFTISTNHTLNPLINQDLIKRLGWVTVDDPNNVCGGYYVEPKLSAFGQPTETMQQSQTSITYHEATFSQTEPSIFSGNVVVIQSGRRLVSDKAIVYRDPNTGKLIAIDLRGNIQIFEPGRMIAGEAAHLSFDQKSGYINNVTYRILLAKDDQIAADEQSLNEDTERLTSTTGWGQATHAIQSAPGEYEFRNATYTTCPPTENQWRVEARNIKIDRAKERGVARDVKLTVGGMPVFYTPYLSFPTSKKRKTGFLFPSSGSSTNGGFEFSLPFYWNMAPNYDMTITPRYYSRRGVLFDDLFRYLTPDSVGQFRLDFLPNDHHFKKFKSTAEKSYPNEFGLPALLHASNKRGLFSWQNTTQFDPHWASLIDYTSVSDDYFFQDFGGIPALFGTNQVERQANVTYTGENWNFIGMLQGYHTLHPVNRQPINNLYSRVPEFDLNADYPDAFDGFDFITQNQAVYFNRSIGPGEIFTPLRGSRFNTTPGISYPIYHSSGFFIPNIMLNATQYALENPQPLPNIPIVPVGNTLLPLTLLSPPLMPKNLNRTLPVVSIDSGLYFDRDVTFLDNEYQQTLEPRLFYLYVPYKNQNNNPDFDSGIIPFSYDQLFATNRFSGGDRLGDANQISAALETQFIDQKTGNEKFHASIGEILYFAKRRVTLCNTPGCSDFTFGLGGLSNTEQISPIAGKVGYFFNPAWSVNGDLTWDPSEVATETGNFYFQYSPDEAHLLNFGYNFLRNGDIIQSLPNITVPQRSSKNDLNQISVSFAFPLALKWSTVGLWNYNISQRHPQTYLFGLQYENCCWAARIVGGRTFTALDQTGRTTFNSAVYLQLELKGLANFDPFNTSSRLTSQIPGYHDPFAGNNEQHIA